jgi:hypothetical protein
MTFEFAAGCLHRDPDLVGKLAGFCDASQYEFRTGSLGGPGPACSQVGLHRPELEADLTGFRGSEPGRENPVGIAGKKLPAVFHAVLQVPDAADRVIEFQLPPIAIDMVAAVLHDQAQIHQVGKCD